MLGVSVFPFFFKESQVEDVYDLFHMKPEDWDEYVGQQYDITDNHKATFTSLHKNKLTNLLKWYKGLASPSLDAWFSLTKAGFNEFSEHEVISSPKEVLQPLSNTNFMSGIKKNISDYPKLKEDKFFRGWYRQFSAIAATHDVSEVLDPDYTPSLSEKSVFEAKNTFVYSVLVSSLKTTKSNQFVRVYEKSKDGQSVLRDLCKAYQQGTIADLSAEVLEIELLNFKLDDKWNKSLEHFLDMWNHKVMDLEQLKDTVIYDSTKQQWLTSAIHGHAQLYAGINQSKIIEHTMSGLGSTSMKLSFLNFFEMILSHAQVIDMNNA